MQPRWSRASVAVVAMVTVAFTLVVYASWSDRRDAVAGSADWTPLVGAPGGPSTSRADLDRAAGRFRSKLTASPGKPGTAVALASALLRQARVDGDAGLAVEAEQALRAALDAEPANYLARRTLAAVLLSQHRFHAAIAAADDTRAIRPRDAENYGALGDGYLEIGDYERAFDAYDRMMELRPSAAAYARMAHAYEMQGDLERALTTMRIAAEATSPHDPEAQAWTYAQIGNLYYQMGRLDDATREYRRADHLFPDHPYARVGLGRVHTARGDYARALPIYRALMRQAPTPELAAQIGDLLAARGEPGADAAYAEAERLERAGWELEQPQYAALARFLAERGRDVAEAVRLAERAARARRDVATLDALAWAYFQAGRVDEAVAASEQALRRGTRDRRVLYHAAAIRHAAGDTEQARTLVGLAVADHPTFDLVNAPAAVELAAALQSADTNGVGTR